MRRRQRLPGDRRLHDQQRRRHLRRGAEAELVTAANIEALDFVQELISKGYADPGAPATRRRTRRRSGRPGSSACRSKARAWRRSSAGTWATDVVVGEPLTGASGPEGRAVLPEQHHDVHEHPDPRTGRRRSSRTTTRHGAAVDPAHRYRPAGAEVDRGDSRVPVGPERGEDASTLAADREDLGGARRQALFANVALVDSTTPMTNVRPERHLAKQTPRDALTLLQNTLMGNLKG